MGNTERQVMEQRLAGMTDDQKDRLLLELAEGMRPGDDDHGRGRVQSAEAILALRPKVEVWTLLPRTGRIDKRKQDRKVWDTPGVLDPYAAEDMPDRPQIIKVIDLQDGTVLFERDSVLSQPQPGHPVALSPSSPGVERHEMVPAGSQAAHVVEAMQHPEVREAVMAMLGLRDDQPAEHIQPRRRGRPPKADQPQPTPEQEQHPEPVGG